MKDDKKIGLVLLAAGASQRLGGYPKQLLHFKGKTLLRRAAENATSSVCCSICVVLGANAAMLSAEIAELPVEIAVNENWKNGMGSSLQVGLKKLLEVEPEISAVTLTLCDQPFVTSSIINQLVGTIVQSKKPIVACEYGETIGVPAIFARSLFKELLNLSAETGAKKIVTNHITSVAKISFPEAAFDIDTWQDYELLMGDGKQ